MSFRARAYLYNTLSHRLTELEDSKKLNKWVNKIIMNPTKLPKPLPKKTENKRKPQ